MTVIMSSSLRPGESKLIPLAAGEDEDAAVRSHEFDPRYIGSRLDSLDEALMLQKMNSSSSLPSDISEDDGEDEDEEDIRRAVRVSISKKATAAYALDKNHRSGTLDGSNRTSGGSKKLSRDEANKLNGSDGSLFCDDSPIKKGGGRAQRRISYNDHGALEMLFAKVTKPDVAAPVTKDKPDAERPSHHDLVHINVVDKGPVKASIVTKQSIEGSARGVGLTATTSSNSKDFSHSPKVRSLSRERRPKDTSGLSSSNHNNTSFSSRDPLGSSSHSTGRARRGRKNSLLTGGSAPEGGSLSPVPSAPTSLRGGLSTSLHGAVEPPSQAKLRGISPVAMRRKGRNQSLDGRSMDNNNKSFSGVPRQSSLDSGTSGNAADRRKQLMVDITDSSFDLFGDLPTAASSRGDDMNLSGHFSTGTGTGRRMSSGGGASQRRRMKRGDGAGDPLGSSSYHGPPPTSSESQGAPRRARSSERRRRKSNESESNVDDEACSPNTSGSEDHDDKEKSNQQNTRSHSIDGSRRRRVASRERRTPVTRRNSGDHRSAPHRSNSVDGAVRRRQTRSAGGRADVVVDVARTLYQQDTTTTANPADVDVNTRDEEHNSNKGKKDLPSQPPSTEERLPQSADGAPRRSRRHSVEMLARQDSSARERSASRNRRPRNKSHMATTATSGNSSPDEHESSRHENHHHHSHHGDRSRSPRRHSSGTDAGHQHPENQQQHSTRGTERSRSPRRHSSGQDSHHQHHSSSTHGGDRSRSPKRPEAETGIRYKVRRSNSQDAGRRRALDSSQRTGSRRQLKEKSMSSSSFHYTADDDNWDEGGAADWIKFDGQ